MTKTDKIKTGMFVGRFQPPHEGHFSCIRHILTECDRVIVMIRDTARDAQNPFSVQDRWDAIRKEFPDTGKVIISRLLDEGADLTVYIGRDVGYGMIKLNASLEGISATDIRKQLAEDHNGQHGMQCRGCLINTAESVFGVGATPTVTHALDCDMDEDCRCHVSGAST